MSPYATQFLPDLFQNFFNLFKSVILSGFGFSFIFLLASMVVFSILNWRR